MEEIKEAVKLFSTLSLGKTKNELGKQIKEILKKNGISPDCFNSQFNYYYYW